MCCQLELVSVNGTCRAVGVSKSILANVSQVRCRKGQVLQFVSSEQASRNSCGGAREEGGG